MNEGGRRGKSARLDSCVCVWLVCVWPLRPARRRPGGARRVGVAKGLANGCIMQFSLDFFDFSLYYYLY